VPSECKGEPVNKCHPGCHSKSNMMWYICNGADYGVENLEWFEVRRADGIYVRRGSVDLTDKSDGVLRST